MKKIGHLMPWFHPNGVAIYLFEIIQNLKEFSHEIITGERSQNYPSIPNDLRDVKINKLTPSSFRYSPTPFQDRISSRLREIPEPVLLFLRQQNLKKLAKDFDLIIYHSIDYRILEIKTFEYFHKWFINQLKIMNSDDYISTKKLFIDHSLTCCEFEGSYVPKVTVDIFNNIIITEPHSIEKVKDYALLNGQKKNIWYVPNSVNINRFTVKKPTSNKKLVIGLSGRLSSRGDLHFKLMDKNLDNIEIHLAMFGSKNEVYEFKNKWKSQNIVMYENLSQEQMPFFYNNIDVLLDPLSINGIGRSVLEAMSCGVPSIKVGNMDFYPVINEINGFVIENNINSLLILLKNIERHREVLLEYGKNARSLIEREYSHDVVIPKLKKIIKSVIEK